MCERSRAYSGARHNAKRRGIPFTVTFEEWWAVWDASGQWAKRGRSRGCYQMDRVDNALGYVCGNLQVIPGRENRTKDSPHGWAPKLTENAVLDIRENFRKGARGWRFFAQRYGVSVAAIKAVRTRRNWRMPVLCEEPKTQKAAEWVSIGKAA